MRSSVSLEIGSSEWRRARCLEGSCPLHSRMADATRTKVLKTCIKMKSYDDVERTYILTAVRCPSDKHDPL